VGHIEERIAEFIAEIPAAEVPEAAVRAAHRSSFDCVGCILAAAAQPDAQRIISFAEQEGATGKAAVLGTGLTTSPGVAALANGTLAHWLDYDDGRTACGHAASVLFPATLAMAQSLGAGGRDLLVAYAIGLEVVNHISDACRYEEKVSGFHRTALFGILGATAAAARLAGLDQRRTMMALGTAGSMPSGLVRNFGSHTKPLHAGMAARGAVTAVQLAADGWTGSADILGGQLGWADSYIGDYDYDTMARGLGERWLTAETPPLIKEYPCCGASHGPLEALFALMSEHGFTAADVEEVEVGAPHDSMVMMYREPASGFQGKFSLLYSVATALVDGRLDVDSFSDAKLARPEYAEAAAKVRITLTSSWDSAGTGGNDHARVKPGDTLPVVVRLKDGRRLERASERIAGLRTPEAVEGKFRDNAARLLPAARVAEAVVAWGKLPELSEVGAAVRTVC